MDTSSSLYPLAFYVTPASSALSTNSLEATTLSTTTSKLEPFNFADKIFKLSGQQSLRSQERRLTFTLQSEANNLLTGSSQVGSSLSDIARTEQQRLHTYIKTERELCASQKNCDPVALRFKEIDREIEALRADSSSTPLFLIPLKVQVAHVALQASAVRTVSNGIDWVIDGALTGVAKTTLAVCSSHPVLQQRCQSIAQGGAHFVDTIDQVTEKYWTGSNVEQGVQTVANAYNQQYEEVTRLFDENLRQQGLAEREIKAHNENTRTIVNGVIGTGLSISAVDTKDSVR